MGVSFGLLPSIWVSFLAPRWLVERKRRSTRSLPGCSSWIGVSSRARRWGSGASSGTNLIVTTGRSSWARGRGLASLTCESVGEEQEIPVPNDTASEEDDEEMNNCDAVEESDDYPPEDPAKNWYEIFGTDEDY